MGQAWTNRSLICRVLNHPLPFCGLPPAFSFPALVPCLLLQVEYYAMLAKVGVHHYSGDNNDLGASCGKFFRVGMLSITDPGDSEIITVMPQM